MEENIFVHALIIADNHGRFLVDLIRNKALDTNKLSMFISAFKVFGEETLGNIKAISIDGLDINMLVVSKHGLLVIAIMDAFCTQVTDFKTGCEKALDVFYKQYCEQINDWDGNLSTFRDFKEILNDQIQVYLSRLQALKLEKLPVANSDNSKMKNNTAQSKRKFSKKRGE